MTYFEHEYGFEPVENDRDPDDEVEDEDDWDETAWEMDREERLWDD